MSPGPEHRSRMASELIRVLDEDRDGSRLVHAYFDEDRDALVHAAAATLEATREEADPVRIAQALDRELIAGLRFPDGRTSGPLVRLYIRRGRVLATLLSLAAAAALLVL